MIWSIAVTNKSRMWSFIFIIIIWCVTDDGCVNTQVISQVKSWCIDHFFIHLSTHFCHPSHHCFNPSNPPLIHLPIHSLFHPSIHPSIIPPFHHSTVHPFSNRTTFDDLLIAGVRHQPPAVPRHQGPPVPPPVPSELPRGVHLPTARDRPPAIQPQDLHRHHGL